jgi:hypothetical protein
MFESFTVINPVSLLLFRLAIYSYIFSLTINLIYIGLPPMCAWNPIQTDHVMGCLQLGGYVGGW